MVIPLPALTCQLKKGTLGFFAATVTSKNDLAYATNLPRDNFGCLKPLKRPLHKQNGTHRKEHSISFPTWRPTWVEKHPKVKDSIRMSHWQRTYSIRPVS